MVLLNYILNGSVRKLPEPVPVKMGAITKKADRSMLTAAIFPDQSNPEQGLVAMLLYMTLRHTLATTYGTVPTVRPGNLLIAHDHEQCH